ncbi:MAG: branched-chain amino acid transport system ATP-binding protein [archaeon GW2011_AR3]|nr:MAG: branched-chain amino acid transport system ATP-binding protein [archaeon GW2011_AR3]MBS3109271.1 ABC transporter ATP-binding protein [Candidatus Woesearchaeota archaeon]
MQETWGGFGKLQILFGMDLAVRRGGITVLIGPNGAGKSTVLKSIFNLTTIYGGNIFLNGKDITGLPTYELIELGIGYVPQGRQIFPSLTVKENLEMGAFLSREPDLVGKRIGEIMGMFPDLKARMQDYAFSLSGGQQQLLAMARAMMQNPSLLLLDEPSIGLAPRIVGQIFQKIQEINNKGTSILMVEQNARMATAIADEIYVLESGKIALHGDRKILKMKKIQQIYLGGY